MHSRENIKSDTGELVALWRLPSKLGTVSVRKKKTKQQTTARRENTHIATLHLQTLRDSLLNHHEKVKNPKNLIKFSFNVLIVRNHLVGVAMKLQIAPFRIRNKVQMECRQQEELFQNTRVKMKCSISKQSTFQLLLFF